MLRKMIFITGANGFIGTNLVKKLVKLNEEIVCLVRKNSNVRLLNSLGVKIVKGDITNIDSFKSYITWNTVVIHLAAVTSEVSSDYSYSRRINVEGTENILNLCKEVGIRRFVTLSSESTKREIKGSYAKTKSEADEIIRKFGVPYTIIRPSIVYGPGAGGLFKKTLGYIERLPFVPIVGKGNQRFSPIYVGDVVDVIIKCMNSEVAINKEYDLTGKDYVSFNQFVDCILSEKGIKKKKLHVPFWIVYSGVMILSKFVKNPPVTVDNLLGLKQEIHMDYDLASKDLGFNPFMFKDGLNKTFYDFIESGKIRIAIVGLGKMGLLHASIINKINAASLVGVVDKKKGIIKQLRGLGINVPVFKKPEDLIKKVKPDGVFICTPPNLNLDIAKKFVNEGISVFVEKPLSSNIGQSREMVAISGKYNIRTSCGHMVAYNPIFNEVKKIIKSEKYGAVKTFTSKCYISQVFKKKSKSSVWQYNPSITGGGVLITMASHLVFLLQWYFGNCLSVNGTSKSLYTEMDDEVNAKLRFGNGIEGSMETSWSKPGYSNLTIMIELVTENAKININDKMIVVSNNSGLHKEIHISELEDQAEFELGGKGYYSQDYDFIHSIIENKDSMLAWKNVIHTYEVIDAIYKSIGCKSEIHVRK